eukprot:COSAG04_NODE_6143_length_1398_cov_11.665331_1_plen_227_part_00
MSNPVAEMQSTLDDHKQALPNGAYVQLCNTLKDLHSLTNIYTVKYCEVKLEGATLSCHTGSCILPISSRRTRDWEDVFFSNTLPTDFSNLKLHEPFFLSDSRCRIVSSIEPYLKRQREDDEDIDIEQSLKKASAQHEGEFVLRQPSHWYRCLKCNQDIHCNKDKLKGPHCCDWFKNTQGPLDKKAKRVPCNKVNAGHGRCLRLAIRYTRNDSRVIEHLGDVGSIGY